MAHPSLAVDTNAKTTQSVAHRWLVSNLDVKILVHSVEPTLNVTLFKIMYLSANVQGAILVIPCHHANLNAPNIAIAHKVNPPVSTTPVKTLATEFVAPLPTVS